MRQTKSFKIMRTFAVSCPSNSTANENWLLLHILLKQKETKSWLGSPLVHSAVFHPRPLGRDTAGLAEADTLCRGKKPRQPSRLAGLSVSKGRKDKTNGFFF
jgi:hypothetical protein